MEYEGRIMRICEHWFHCLPTFLLTILYLSCTHTLLHALKSICTAASILSLSFSSPHKITSKLLDTSYFARFVFYQTIALTFLLRHDHEQHDVQDCIIDLGLLILLNSYISTTLIHPDQRVIDLVPVLLHSFNMSSNTIWYYFRKQIFRKISY